MEAVLATMLGGRSLSVCRELLMLRPRLASERAMINVRVPPIKAEQGGSS
jgi:hypothetical protein